MIGQFANDKARTQFLAAYDKVLRQWPLPSEELDIDTRFGPTRVRRCGTDTGVPIVLLHGYLGTSLSWYPQIAALGAQHPVYAVDSIGEPGRSVQTEPINTAQDCADWLTDVLTGIGPGKVHLVGMSRGGWLALNLATRSPELLAGLTLLDPAGFRRIDFRFFLWSLSILPTWFAPPAMLRRFSRWDPSIRDTLRQLLFPALGYRVRLPPPHPFTDEELRAVTVPTHLVLAEHSALHRSKQVLARAQAVLPSVHAEIVPRTTHALPMEEPEQVTARILASREAR